MTSATLDRPNALILAGYQAVFPRGFALPCFGTSPRPNQWHLAVAVVEGDHQSPIAGFTSYEPDDVIHLPADLLREVSIGEPWHDVFVHDGRVLVGRPQEIVDALGVQLEALAVTAPGEALDLAFAARLPTTSNLVRLARASMEDLYGEARAEAWLKDLVVRGEVRMQLRRRLVQAGVGDDRNLVRQVVVEGAGTGYRLAVPSSLVDLFNKADARTALEDTVTELSHALTLDVNVHRLDHPDYVQDVVVRGLRRVSGEAVLAAAGLQIGAPLSDDLLRQVESRILALDLFQAVSVGRTRGLVVIEVAEHPIIDRIRIRGAGALSETTIKARLPAVVDQPASRAKLREVVDRIDRLYSERRLNAKIDVRVAAVQNQFELRIEIHERQGQGRPAGPEDIRVIYAGPAARGVARWMSTPDWSPFPDRAYVARGGGPSRVTVDAEQLCRIDIEPAGEEHSESDHGVVVLVVDDVKNVQSLFDTWRPSLFATKRRFLIAPIPDPSYPSGVLQYREALTVAGETLLIDTSVVRSPFWSSGHTASAQALAAYILGAAMIAATDQLSRTGRPGLGRSLPILAFVPENPLGRLAMASEVSPDRGSADRENVGDFSFEMFRVDRSEQTRAFGSITSGPRPEKFGQLAAAVLASPDGHQTTPSSMEDIDRSVQDPWAYQLRYPDLLARLDKRHGVKAGGKMAIITAEAPPLAMIVQHEASGTSVARYTDVETLFRLKSPVENAVLANDIALPELRRLPASRGWARRGLDSRRLMEQLPAETFAQFEGGDQLFRSIVRRLRTSIDGVAPATVVAPTRETEEAAQRGDRLADIFLARERPDRGRLPNSAAIHWNAPQGGAERFLLPTTGSRLTVGRLAHDEVAGLQFIVLDGDVAVPWILTSRMFQIWIRATSTDSGGRYRVSTSMVESFPLPSFTELIPGNAYEAPILVCLDDKLRTQLRKIDDSVWRSGPIGRSLDNARDALAEYEDALLAGYDLPSGASDIQILDRLVRLNRGDDR